MYILQHGKSYLQSYAFRLNYGHSFNTEIQPLKRVDNVMCGFNSDITHSFLLQLLPGGLLSWLC